MKVLYNKERTLPYTYNINLNMYAVISQRMYPSPEAFIVLAYMQQVTVLTEYQKFAIKEGDEVYYWFKHTNIIRALPILFHEERASLSKEERSVEESKIYEVYRKKLHRIIVELTELGVIKKAEFSQLESKTYYCFTQKHDNLIQKNTLGTFDSKGRNQKFQGRGMNDSNNYSNNKLDQIKNLEKLKISVEKISPDAALAPPSASSETKRFKLSGKTIAQIADDLFYLYHGNKTFMEELLDNLKVNKIDCGNNDDIRAKRLLSFFKSWGYFWNEKNRKRKIPLEVELHNEIMGDIGKMIKSKALEVSAAAASPSSDAALLAALDAGTLTIRKRR